LEFSDILAILGILFGGAGSIGAIICVLITSRLNKQMELFKSNLEGKQYVSKTRFDAEFAMYRELSKTFYEMVYFITELVPGPLTDKLTDEDEKIKCETSNYDKAYDAFIKARSTIYVYAPFIEKEIESQFKKLWLRCYVQLKVFKKRFKDRTIVYSEEDQLKDLKKNRRIFDKCDELCIKSRQYLSSLVVKD